jgi:hypothetical protein
VESPWEAIADEAPDDEESGQAIPDQAPDGEESDQGAPSADTLPVADAWARIALPAERNNYYFVQRMSEFREQVHRVISGEGSIH